VASALQPREAQYVVAHDLSVSSTPGRKGSLREDLQSLPSENNGLSGGEPDLVSDYHHHEDEVEAEGPEDEKLAAFEMAARDGVFFGFDELLGFEGGEDPGLIGVRDRG
jgi:hypothetical protein